MLSSIGVFLLALTLAANGYRLENEDEYDPFEPFISGGSNAVLGQFPSVVAVVVPQPINAFCGGIILNQNHVLTAARCVLTAQNLLLFPNQVTIAAGTLQLNFATPRITVSAIYVHPAYNPFTFANNLAVLRATSNFIPPEVPVPNIAFAIPNEDIAHDGMPCQVAGWNNATNNPVQQFINVPILNRDTCNAVPLHLTRIGESMVCAGSVAAGPGVCASNMGTGLFCEGRATGILSTGFGCGQANNPGVYTQIRFYTEWIQQQFERQDVPQGGLSPIPIW
ncbi:trypsin-like [Toxorhynchites rutilus septentrionalis]|uniref:trypsin-like n=1 Tax=Toxorhynchites rutilus septentrionalis TaxID=329112 RepID=UPI00247942C6|nr:trypsin-like [Toxorhynchites rutilus septentrionalis]